MKLTGPKYDDYILPVRGALTLTFEGSVMGLPFSPLYALTIMLLIYVFF